MEPDSGPVLQELCSEHICTTSPCERHAVDAMRNDKRPFTWEFCSFDEVECLAKSLSTQIFGHQRKLYHILERYEPLIRKRWIKKAHQQRSSILLAAAPNMPRLHRPDIGSLHRSKELPEDQYRTDNWKDHFLLPSINLEDLSITKNLLLFMHSRGRNNPGLFAIADFTSVYVGLFTTDLVLPYVYRTTMMLDGNDPSTYGRLHNCGSDNNMAREIKAKKGTVTGIGVLILVIQERKLDFLRRCAELILHDIPLDDPRIPLQPDPGEVVLANEEAQHLSLQTDILEASYRVPPRYDMSRIRSFVFAKRDEYQDEIWNLREDPVYFAETILEWAEHRHEQVRMSDGSVSPELEKKEWWERTISTMVGDVYTSFHAWNCLSKQVEKLAALNDTYDDHVHDGNKAKCHEDAVNYLEFLVIQAMKRLLVKWQDGLGASPQLRKHFAVDVETGEGYPKVPWEQQKDKFLWLLELPLFDDIFKFCVSSVMDAIDWMMCTSQQNRSRMSPWLVSVVSELSLLGELERQLSLFNERLVWTGYPNTTHQKLAEYCTRFFHETQDMERVYSMLDNDDLQLAPFAMPFDKFNFPCHRRRTAMTTRTMQEAEKALDKFWQHIDVHSVSTCGKTFHKLFNFEFEERELARTPDWSDADAPRPTPKRRFIAEASLEDHLAATLHFELNSEPTTSQETVVTPKQKIKTRGIPAVSPPQGSAISHQADTTQVDPKIAVSKRAMKTFSTLFFDDSYEAPPGELPWTEFLHAMASAGFTNQKLNGSAWIFEPTNDIFRRSIIFHEPHPVAKIRYQLARMFGRRLNRAYGWTAETFKRVQKGSSE